MTARTIVQVTPAEAATGADSDTATFSGATADGNSVYAFVALKTNSVTPVVDEVTITGSGSPITMALVTDGSTAALQEWLYEGHKVLGIYAAHDLDPDTYTVEASVNGGATNAAVSVGAIEVSGPDYGVEVVRKNNTGNAVASVTVGPTPTLSQDDCVALFVQGATDGSFSDIAFGTQTDWTQRLDQGNGTSGRQSMQVQSRTLTTTAAVTAVGTSGTNDQYGRAGILLILKGSASAPTDLAVKVISEDLTLVGKTGLEVEIHLMPVSSGRRGARLLALTDQAFEATAENIGGTDYAVMYCELGASSGWEVPGAGLVVDDTVVVDVGEPNSVDADILDAASVGPTVCSIVEAP